MTLIKTRPYGSILFDFMCVALRCDLLTLHDLTLCCDLMTLHDLTLSRDLLCCCQPVVEEWERKLYVFGRTLDEWMNCQRNWLYLEQIFTAPDIQR